MKKSITHLLATLCVILAVNNSTFSKSGEDFFYSNPLILNGLPLNYNTFWTGSKGTLALVKGNPNAADSHKVPFKIYLKHEGRIVNKGLSSDTRECYEVKVDYILALAHFGDELVIEPARKSDTLAKRVIKLTKTNMLYMIFSPLFAKPKGALNDGC